MTDTLVDTVSAVPNMEETRLPIPNIETNIEEQASVDTRAPEPTELDDRPASILKSKKRSVKQEEAFIKCQQARAMKVAERKQIKLNERAEKKRIKASQPKELPRQASVKPNVVYIDDPVDDEEDDHTIYVKRKRKKKKKQTRIVYVSDDSTDSDGEFYDDYPSRANTAQLEREMINQNKTMDCYRFM